MHTTRISRDAAGAGLRAGLAGAGLAAAVLGAALGAVLGAPVAGADPLPSNCMSGTDGMTYCDTDVSADGRWSRCARPDAATVFVFGGAVAGAPVGAQTCQTVTSASVPVGSPPFHIGYGGEATGRM